MQISTKSLMSFFKPGVSLSLNFALPLVSWHTIPLKFSSWNIICFGQKELLNVQFFRFLSALMKVHPIPHAIFETKRSGFIHILHHCSVPWKITRLVVSEMTRIWWILIWALKRLNNKLHFDWSLLWKVYNVWPKKYRGAIFHDAKVSGKIWGKTDLWFGKWQEEFGKFLPEHMEVSNLGHWQDPFSKIKYTWAEKLQRSYV